MNQRIRVFNQYLYIELLSRALLIQLFVEGYLPINSIELNIDEIVFCNVFTWITVFNLYFYLRYSWQMEFCSCIFIALLFTWHWIVHFTWIRQIWQNVNFSFALQCWIGCEQYICSIWKITRCHCLQVQQSMWWRPGAICNFLK